MKTLIHAACACALVAHAGAQNTINVPADHASISVAVGAASPGDTVLVSPGSYFETATIDFKGKDIVLRSTGGPEVTTIDALNARRVFLFNSGETSSAVVDGFTISRGRTTGAGGGAAISGSSPTIRNCRFVECEAGDGAAGLPTFPGTDGQSGGALYLASSSSRIERCEFLDNQAGDGGRGGHGPTGFAGAPFVNGHTGFAGEKGGTGGAGGAVYAVSSALVIVDCLFDSNRGGNGGYGGLGGRGGEGYNFFGLGYTTAGGAGGKGGNGGSAKEGAAVRIEGGSQVDIVNCTFVNNLGGLGGAAGTGGPGGLGTATGATGANGLRGNDGAVGGINSLFPASTTARNSIFWGNTLPDVNSVLPTSYCLVDPGIGEAPGPGDLHGSDPLFVDFAGGDYRLQTTSPCIDAASNGAVPAGVSEDLAGNPRFFDHPLVTVAGAGPVDMGAFEFAEPFVLPYGCGLNPAGSLVVLAGEPRSGQTLTFGLNNPFGTQGAGALPYLLFSAVPPADPCGVLVGGLGMAGNTVPGAVQLDLSYLEYTVGGAWSGAGFAPVDVPIPNLIGVSVWLQGLLVGGSGTNKAGLTDAIRIVIGP